MGLLGAHVSISGSLIKAIEQGETLGCEAIQIFTKNQRRWNSPSLSDDTIQEFKKRWEASAISKLVVHDSYLINLASPDDEMLKKSREAFFDEVDRADRLGADFLVFHPGSHMNTGETEGLTRIVQSLQRIFDRKPDVKTGILLEITAGQGHHLGYRFEQLAEIIHQVNHDKMGVCFDTAHAYSAGLDIHTEEAYQTTMSQFDEIIGLNRLGVFHLNDSKVEFGSRKDRHDNIGDGTLGLSPFEWIVKDKRFESTPMILETPGGDAFFAKNLNILRQFRNERIPN